jgi:hypothetical protein
VTLDRFVISTSASEVPAASKNILTIHLNARHWNVWHQQEDLWLISKPASRLTATQLNSELVKVIPGLKKSLIVLKVDGSCQYDGWQNPEAWPWMVQFWGKPQG